MNIREGRPLYVIGDIHGHHERVAALLQAAGLIDGWLAWAGGRAALWCLGDFFDRGPSGVASVDLWMRLGREAAEAGGEAKALLGNHDALILAAKRFGANFERGWLRNGGVREDLDRLTAGQIDWLCGLPALALVDDRLLLHADSLLYLEYGRSIAEVNAAIQHLLRGDDRAAWELLLDRFSDRFAFDVRKPGASDRLWRMLRTFGGRQLIHGHTPISAMRGRLGAQVDGPYVYQGGRCVNADGGLGQGGPGFVERLAPLDPRLRAHRGR